MSKKTKRSGKSRNVRPSALADWEKLKAMWAGRRIAVFLDYDGTLTPIVSRPDMAVLSPKMKKNLQDVSAVHPTLIVSGRGREDVSKLVGMDSLYYAGSHGFDIGGPKGSRMVYQVDKALQREIDSVHKKLSRCVPKVRGALLENKKFSLAVHYRLAAAKDAPRLEAMVDDALRGSRKLRKAHGKKVFEIRPVMKWDKGRALLWLQKALHLEDAAPIYIGDDTTDEDAFKVLRGGRGVGILVSEKPKPTAAAYSLRNVEEVGKFLKRLVRRSQVDDWTLAYDGYVPDQEGLREALCALGNGFFCARGAAEECRAGDIHYPGTYMHGGYNRLPSKVMGQTIYNEDLVNLPNWLPINFQPKGGEWVEFGKTRFLSYRQELRLKEGVLAREYVVKDGKGRVTGVRVRRIVHMRSRHLAAIEYSITPKNWSGSIRVRSMIDADFENSGVKRYRELSSKHHRCTGTGAAGSGTVFLTVKTTQSDIEVSEAARSRVYRGGREVVCRTRLLRGRARIGQEFSTTVKRGSTLTVEKVVALTTSRDRGINESALGAHLYAQGAGRFQDLLDSHALAWSYYWHRCDVRVEPEERTDESRRMQLILRVHIFHTLQTACQNTIARDTSVPARGLHGEAYRGHIFWDELYIFPFFRQWFPEVLRSLLFYRYNRLAMARANARKAGFRGAMFPWQSSSDGREESQVLHYNPKSGKWDPDHSSLQRHVNIAVIYNVWRYYDATGDRYFMERCGAELVLDVARFWASAAVFNRRMGRYEIKGVMGPDEYHEMVPWSKKGGLDNNTYTNVMVVWCLQRALDVLKLVSPEVRRVLRAHLQLGEDELDRWRHICRRMRVVRHDRDIFSQFEGYERLEEFDWDGYRRKYGNISRLDRILKAEGDSPDRYKLSKQADVVMLFYLLDFAELQAIFKQLRIPFSRRIMRDNVEYYMKRTSHGSTLSKMVFASVMEDLDRRRSWELYSEALTSDVDDVQGGTTPEGIHLGAMTGTVDIALKHFAGIDAAGSCVGIRPDLPEAVRGMKLRILFRGRWAGVHVTKKRLTVSVDRGAIGPVPLKFKGKLYRLAPGAKRGFAV